jgi:SAM-dependent methyltransferase
MTRKNEQFTEIWDYFWKDKREIPTSDRTYRADVAEKKLDFFLAQGVSFNQNSKVIECGCGDGEVALAISKRFGAKVVGIDSSPEACKQTNNAAVMLGLNVSAIQADAKEIPVQDCSIDVAVSLGVIEHDKDPMKQIKELARVVKHGGVLVLMTPNYWSFAKADRLWRETLGTWPIGYQREFSPRKLQSMTLSAGFNKASTLVTLREMTPSRKAPIDRVAIADNIIAKLTRSKNWGFYSWVFAKK